MLKKEISVVNKLGLHARAAAKLTHLASGFECTIWISRKERRVNAKSIMGVMMLAAGLGSSVVVETEGNDETAAMSAIEMLFSNKFGEGA